MTEWRFCVLTITGDDEHVAAFQTEAMGAAGIPWHYPDLQSRDEERLANLVIPPDGSLGLDLHDAKTLTRLLRTAVETHHGHVLTAAHGSRTCPFSLHRLLPVPAEILRLGPDDPISRTWLATNWGAEAALRQVRRRPEPPSRRLRRGARVSYDFWSAGAAPIAAITHLANLWPGLVFDLRPTPGP